MTDDMPRDSAAWRRKPKLIDRRNADAVLAQKLRAPR